MVDGRERAVEGKMSRDSVIKNVAGAEIDGVADTVVATAKNFSTYNLPC